MLPLASIISMGMLVIVLLVVIVMSFMGKLHFGSLPVCLPTVCPECEEQTCPTTTCPTCEMTSVNMGTYLSTKLKLNHKSSEVFKQLGLLIDRFLDDTLEHNLSGLRDYSRKYIDVVLQDLDVDPFVSEINKSFNKCNNLLTKDLVKGAHKYFKCENDFLNIKTNKEMAKFNQALIEAGKKARNQVGDYKRE
jgi:hypothetical protein